MKKILTLLAGIVFLTSILVAGGCGSAEVPKPLQNLDVVVIYVKAIQINGENHLEMYDSNDSTKVIDTLVTDVKPGTEVFWVLAPSSGLEKVTKIKPKNPGGSIIPAPTGLFPTNQKKLKVPNNANPGEEGYLIRVKDLEGNRWEIDPYLRIR